MRNDKAKIFLPVLDTFENEDLKSLAELIIDDFPDYFFDVGASSTGKYHPQYALGDLGLARHTVALTRFMNHMFSIEQTQNDFNSRERDLLRIAGIAHDSRKSGEADNKSRYTVFDHPLLAAKAVRKFKGSVDSATDEEVELIANAIESHMGQWNTDKRSAVVLPKPENKYQKLLHICDYLASRKDIEVLFEEYQKPELPKLEDYTLDFGKYRGYKLVDIAKGDPGYIAWLKENMSKEPVRTLIKQL